jgi:type II secretory pathway component GspD/PulD (secretin)
VDIKTLVTGANTTVSNNNTNYGYQVTNSPFGITVDVVPSVLADGNSILMTVIPTVTEFLGYEDPKELSKYDKNLKHLQLPLPKSRVRRTITARTVSDGQTLVIGKLSDEQVILEPNGTELRQPFAGKKKKQLIIFITVTIVDSHGIALHEDDIHSHDYYDTPVIRNVTPVIP